MGRESSVRETNVSGNQGRSHRNSQNAAIPAPNVFKVQCVRNATAPAQAPRGVPRGRIASLALRTLTYGWIGFQFLPEQAAEVGRHLVGTYGGREAAAPLFQPSNSIARSNQPL
jgi:hypothetical protein